MNLEPLVALARKKDASDLHLEIGLTPSIRVRGVLEPLEAAGGPTTPETMASIVKSLAGDLWSSFEKRRSLDLSRTIASVRCRINLFRSSRGYSIALRLLSSVQPTLASLNLHPDLKKLVTEPHGLILVSGPTGCGKSSTLAALIHEINSNGCAHIVTLEQPIEYTFRPRKAFIRQREVGRDTPSFERGLEDALREDPDVLMVGEIRSPKSMRLTLNAAETGHLVLTTVHSSNPAEALQRIVSAFSPKIQHSVRSQLAECLIAVVTQHLRYRPELDRRVPECEILKATTPTRSLIRRGQFFKLPQVMETSHQDGMWTTRRYQDWLQRKTDWSTNPAPEVDRELATIEQEVESRPLEQAVDEEPALPRTPRVVPPPAHLPRAGRSARSGASEDVIEIKPPDQTMDDILSELGDE